MGTGTVRRLTPTSILLLAWGATPFAMPPAGGQTAPALPQVSTMFPPGIKVGGREVWVVRGRRLGRVDRVEVEGTGVRGHVTRRTDDSVTIEADADPGAIPGFREVRLAGEDGVSNLRLVRVDQRLGQLAESEPNDTTGRATVLPSGMAGAGVLRPRDVDHFRVEGRRGSRMTVDLEARRLGAPVVPVVTVLSTAGRALHQARETPGVNGDCRFVWTVPADGPFVIQVRDNLYGGSGSATYRLRVSDEPFATGLFPLGGPPGKELEVAASGGNLRKPLRQKVLMPENPGALVELPPFQGPDGPVLAPGRLVVDEGPVRIEPIRERNPPRPTRLTRGVEVDGCLDRPEGVDAYRFHARRGESNEVQVVAARLGSQIDAVLTLRDAQGKVLVENDDNPHPLLSGEAASTDLDSRLSVPEGAEGDLTVEVKDRFGRGGPEFGYRLFVGPPIPEVRVSGSWEGSEWGSNADRGRSTGGTGLPSGVVVFRAGAEVALVVRVARRGGTGPVKLKVEGLPPGVDGPAVVVRRFQPVEPAGRGVSPSWGVGTARMILRVEPNVQGAAGRLRVNATWTPEDGKERTRLVEFPLVIGAGGPEETERTVVRRVTSVPFWVYISGMDIDRRPSRDPG